jgi:hypothetical protein
VDDAQDVLRTDRDHEVAELASMMEALFRIQCCASREIASQVYHAAHDCHAFQDVRGPQE